MSGAEYKRVLEGKLLLSRGRPEPVYHAADRLFVDVFAFFLGHNLTRSAQGSHCITRARKDRQAGLAARAPAASASSLGLVLIVERTIECRHTPASWKEPTLSKPVDKSSTCKLRP